MPIVAPSIASTTSRLFTWTDADGVDHDLSTGQYIRVLWASDGLWMPEYRLVETDLPFGVGTRLRNVRVDGRDMVLPISIITASMASLHDVTRDLLTWFDPTKGDGTLTVMAPDGSERQITARYRGGLEMAEAQDSLGNGWRKAVLRLRAPYPYWEDTADVTQTFSSGVGVATFFPFFPITLLPSQVFGTTSLANTGDLEAWPVWTFTGPGSEPSVSNLTTGETFTSSLTLAAGETLTVDTRPGQKSVVDSSGNNQFRTLSVASSLWSLQPGTNSLSLGMGATTGASSIALAYRRRWLGC